MGENRQYPRIPMKCHVKVTHPKVGAILLESGDISDNGLFLLTEDPINLNIGDVVTGQVQGMMEEAPELRMTVIRLEQSGIGLCFDDD